MKAQRAERDAELRGPAGGISRDDHVPDAVPVLVEIVDPDELGVPHRAVRIGAEDEGPAAAVKAVDQQLAVVVTPPITSTPPCAGDQTPPSSAAICRRDAARALS